MFSIPAHGHVFGNALDLTALVETIPAEFGQIDMSSTELKTLRKPKGIMHKLPLEFWIAGILTILQSSKKILICSIKINQTLLQYL
jgi:hypothetical protein